MRGNWYFISLYIIIRQIFSQKDRMNRREFLQFLGVSGVLATLPSCTNQVQTQPGLPHLTASLEDKLLTSQGLDYKILIKWGESINPSEKFGFNNDFLAFHELSKDRGILWVNHEYVNPVFIGGNERSKKNVDLERLEVGGSLLEVKKQNGEWKVVKDSKYNRRISANTPIPFAAGAKVQGKDVAIGTMGNCAGGKTPWGTILTCEENYDMFWGDRLRNGKIKESWLKWEKYYNHPPEHYGWVVEVNPLTGEAKKHTSLGRCAHECAAVTRAKNGKIVAYTGDDANDEHFYKFISDSTDSLERGKLYVASLEQGKWLSLDLNEQPILRSKFKDQLEVLTFAREAAKLVGATPLARPEDIEFDPLTGHVFVALTNNKPKNDYMGSILKIMEAGNDPGALSFKHETFLTGGSKNGFACPDNMVFDQAGNLWFTTDMAGSEMGKGRYEEFGNNGLYVFLRSGKRAGEVIRVASAPRGAEFTGPCFSPDYETLFLSVQHPGEETEKADKPQSQWPDGGTPRPAVVTLQGPLLKQINSGKL
jgi:secreted PhoX family phosphatase